MNQARFIFVALALAVISQPATAQDRLGYRAFVLESSVDTVLSASGARVADVKVLHERPAVIQELEWRAPYTRAANEAADPVRQVLFSFCDNALYQVLVSYDPDRTDGLGNADIIGALTTIYGTPVPAAARNRPLDAASDTVVLAQWDRAGSSLTLLRAIYSAEFQLMLTSKVLSTRARGTIREAARLDTVEAPRREAEQRKKDAADAAAVRDRIRATNKAAFRP